MIKLKAYKFNFKLPEPLTISFHTWYFRENILIKLEWEGLTGLGEAAPFKLITGDDQRDVLDQAKLVSTISLDPSQDSIETLHNYLNEHNITSTTLRCAIDFAYHDLLGQVQKIPVYKLYSPEPRLVENSVTIFIKGSPESTQKEAQRIFALYPHLKLTKIKLKGDGDIERAKSIKAVAPPHMKFTVDANQGFEDPKEAVKTLEKIKNILGEVIAVEEPCKKGDLTKLSYVKENLSSPVFADESAATLDDAKKVAETQSAKGINIKLQKAGGIYPSKKIAKICEEAGLLVMVGSMLDGPIAITAGTHFAVSTPNVLFTDLDMDLDMPPHSQGSALFKDGKRIPTEKPGLGVTLDQSALEALKAKGDFQTEQVV